MDGQPWVMSVAPGEPAGRCLGLAIDLGTTSIEMELVDLATGALLDTQLAYNGQRKFGADVTSRLLQAEKRGGAVALHGAVVSTLNSSNT